MSSQQSDEPDRPTALVRTLLALRHEADRQGAGWRWWFYAVLGFPLTWSILEMLTGDSDIATRMVALVAMALAVLALGYDFAVRRATRVALRTSDIAARIAEGHFGDDPIFALTPWPWRNSLPRAQSDASGSGSDLRIILRRIGANLDWYLHPPRVLFRAEWLLRPALLGLVLMTATDLLGLSMLNLVYSAHRERWFLLLIAMFTWVVFGRYRQQVWAEELVSYLLGLLEWTKDSQMQRFG